MRLKRKYDPDAVAAWEQALTEETDRLAGTFADALPGLPLNVVREAATVVARGTVDPPSPTHLEVQELRGTRQNFSDRLVDGGVAEGWLTLGRGKITLHTADGDPDASFKVIEVPGVYCCHCGDKLQGGGEIAQTHVAENHHGEESPDPENPSGYRVSRAYSCEVI